jgi:nicotinate-nucleotide adenylyltransferase
VKIGYFGGTFDPPHLGHQLLAGEAFYQLKLDSLHWILTPSPPHKGNQSVTPDQHRLEMLQRMIQEYPDFSISRIDLDREPPHYAADTVELLKKRKPDVDLVYIIGEDSLRDLPDWYQPDRFLAFVDQLCVARRPNITVDLNHLTQIFPDLKQKLFFLSGTMMQISSSMIRDRIKNGGAYRHLVTTHVYEYINNNHPYS